MIVNLKVAILEQYRTQKAFAQKIRMPECVISEVVNGKRNIDEKEMKRWARVLKKPAESLFC